MARVFTIQKTIGKKRGRASRWDSRVRVPRRRTGGVYGRFSNGGELKFFDVPLTDAVIAAGGTITDSINKIAQGVTEVTRVGRKCTIKSISFRYKLTLPEQDAVGSPAVSDTVRLIVYMDKQCNGATAAVTDLLETADFQSFRNLANSGRFVFILDVTKDLNYLTLASDGAGVVSQAEVGRSYTFYKKCNAPIEFNAAAGAITEIRSNNFGMLIMSSGGIAGLDSQFRIRFSDA